MGCAALDFLEDLHRGPGLLHMDIKAENILLDASTMEWVVADYDLFETPSAGPAASFDDDYFWYYMAIGGAEPDKPLITWRTDLLMLGYTLAELTWDVDKFGKWEFYPECNARRRGRTGTLHDLDADELVRVRNTEMLFAEPTVCEFLDAVDELVPWDAGSEPPVAAVYERLRSILTVEPKVSALGPQS
jgi:serine/threonine protein kinase